MDNRKAVIMNINKEEFLELRRDVLKKQFARMNSVQQEAVFKTEGPLLILAGAGSGKTTVLVNRIANIIRFGTAFHSEYISPSITDEDIENCKSYLLGGALDSLTAERLSVDACKPWKVMAITFTNKAAGELKERLCTMLGGDDGEQIWASTFHSSCARMLRRDGDRLGYTSHFTIYDTDDSRRLMKECMKSLDISDKMLTAKSILSEISRAKDSLRGPGVYEHEAGDDFRLKLIARAYKEYQRRLEEADAMDFDDLIINTVKLFEKCPDVLEYYHRRFDYIMVDEYQDTNHAQYKFISLLSSAKRNLCVVGDDDQSIYKFRGATIENIMNFEKEYSDATVIRLEQNYRSTQNILDAANAVISNNSERKGKTLWTDNGEGDKLNWHLASNEQDEADRIARTILDGVAAGRKFSDYAVLYRMNSQSLMIERMFTKHGVPLRIIGGTRFFDRAEVKDMISYLSIVNNPNDEIRLRRIINCPKRGIGNATIDRAFTISEQVGVSFFEVIKNPEDYPVLSRASNKLTQFAQMMDEFTKFHQQEGNSLNELYKLIVEKTEYLEYLRTSDPERAQDKIENVEELSSMIQRYEEDEGASLSGFLEEVSLYTDIDNYDTDSEAVVLMTMHTAKGLEFPVVFLPGFEEGVFPGNSVIYNPAEVEEERRLAYVAITRAKEVLNMYSAESRMIFGMTNRNRRSRFIEEIPEELISESRTNERIWQSTAVSDSGSRAPVAGFMKPAAPKTPTGPKETFMPGDSVSHKTFGTGMILTAEPMGNDTLLEIAFDKVGTKKLFSNFAKLTKN